DGAITSTVEIMSQKIIIITGNSGIGAATARSAAARLNRVFATNVTSSFLCARSGAAHVDSYVDRIMAVVGSCTLQDSHLLDFLTQANQVHWGKGAMPS